MAKTTRIQNRFASQGAVAQNGGDLPLYRCNSCQSEVVWAESKRTGRKYLCNVRTGYHDQRFYVGADVHPRNCGEEYAQRLAQMVAEENARKINTDYQLRIQAAKKAGDRDLALRLIAEWSDLPD